MEEQKKVYCSDCVFLKWTWFIKFLDNSTVYHYDAWGSLFEVWNNTERVCGYKRKKIKKNKDNAVKKNTKKYTIVKDTNKLNGDNDCKHYKRKWWKIWKQ